MKCNNTIRIIDYILTGKEEKGFIDHIEKCPECAKELKEFMEIKKTVSETTLYRSTVSSKTIMSKIRIRTKELVTYPWAISIIISLAGIILVSPAAYKMQSTNLYGSYLIISLHLIFGLLLSCFIFMYMFTHHERAKKIAAFVRREKNHLTHITDRSLRR